MKLGELANPKFFQTLNKLASAELDMPIAYKLKGIMVALDAEHQKYEELRKGLLEKYGQKDEAGELISDERGELKFESDEDRAKLVEEVNELMAVEVDVKTIKVEDVSGVKMSVQELMVIDSVLEQ
jgi:hypothetical protein